MSPTNKLQSEYMDIVNSKAWPLIYQRIGSECEKYQFTVLEARKPKNKLLNRYRDVNPFDHSRVVLNRGPQDYINANHVKVEKANRRYILTQGPLPDTMSHFWLMVFEQNSRAILMLNKIIEKTEIKCYMYWPSAVGPEYKMNLTTVGLTVEQIMPETDYSFYTTRLFRVVDTATGESREVTQYHYTTWPDFGVPSSPLAFLQFLKKVRSSGGLDPEVGPAIVHCSAGIGRSGTFCLVDSCLVLIEKEGFESLDVQKILLEMRRDRMGLIQTPDQLRFSYEAIIEGAKRLETNWWNQEEENIYEAVHQEEEEAPPQPPPRGHSLGFFGPLPPIPNSESLQDIPNLSSSESESLLSESEDSDSEDEDDDNDDTEVAPTNGVSDELLIRRMNQKNLAKRVEMIRQKQRDTERWYEFKKSVLKPVSILSVGVIVCGIIYACIKH